MHQFHDHGWLNGLSEEDLIAFTTERKRHDEEVKAHPLNHGVVNMWSTPRGYDEFKCVCGFGWKCDGGD